LTELRLADQDESLGIVCWVFEESGADQLGLLSALPPDAVDPLPASVCAVSISNRLLTAFLQLASDNVRMMKGES